MNIYGEFWKSIAKRLEEEIGVEIKDWGFAEKKVIINKINARLSPLIETDKAIADKCGNASIGRSTLDRVFPKDGNYTYRGSTRTQNIFAIYFGYDSVDDYIEKNNIRAVNESTSIIDTKNENLSAERKNTQSDNINTDRKWKKKQITFFVVLIASLAGVLSFLFYRSSYNSREFLLFRHYYGIGIINLYSQKVDIISPYEEGITGLNLDIDSRLVFWASFNRNKITVAQLDKRMNKFVPNTTRYNQFAKLNKPCGIALDTKRDVVYCANYGNSTITAHHYNGKLLEIYSLDSLNVKLSAIELNPKEQILYWTDILNHRIGTFDLSTNVANPNFVTNAGLYPDGLSIDTTNRKLYWASKDSGHIGRVNLLGGSARLFKHPEFPDVVEVDGENNWIYHSSTKMSRIAKGQVMPNGQLLFDSQSKNYLENNDLEPSIIKFIRLK